MRSEHNGGASLGAFLLAVSTITLLMVSPVEGQNPPGAGQVCDVTAFPSETGSCPPLDPNDMEPLFCDGDTCEPCFVVGAGGGVSGCDQLSSGPDGPDTVANCQRSCFDFYACATNADCPGTLPFCDIDCELFFPINVICTPGQCVATDPSECVVSALPGEDDSCPDAPQEGFAGPQICGREGVTSYCVPCARNEQERGITTAADCEKLTEVGQTADVVANCQRQCFGFFACETTADCPDSLPFCGTNGQLRRECFGFFCATNADCPDTLPICNAGQCEISVFSPLDGVGGGSSA